MLRVVFFLTVALTLCCAFFVRSERSLEAIPIRFTMHKYETYDRFRRRIGQRFEAQWNRRHPGRPIQVAYEPIGGNYAMKVNTEMVAGTLQDVFFVPDYHRYADLGALLDLTPHIDANDDWGAVGEIYPALVEPLKKSGRLYGLPGNLNTRVLYYNRALFRKAGVPYPDETWDWNDMLAAAKRLTVYDKEGRAVQYGLVPMHWAQFAIENGARFWSEDGERCVIDSAEAREALQFVLDLIHKHHVCPTPTEQQALEGYQAFIANRAGMIIGGRWWTARFWNLSDIEWAIAPLPKSLRGSRANLARFVVLGVNAKTRHPDIAYAFLKFLASPEEMRYLVDLGDSIPMHWRPEHNAAFLKEPRSVPGTNRAHLVGMEDCYTEYDTVFGHPEVPWPEFHALNGLTVGRCYLKSKDAATALAELQEGLQRKLAEYRNPPPPVPLWPYLTVSAIGAALTALAMKRRLRKKESHVQPTQN